MSSPSESPWHQSDVWYGLWWYMLIPFNLGWTWQYPCSGLKSPMLRDATLIWILATVTKNNAVFNQWKVATTSLFDFLRAMKPWKTWKQSKNRVFSCLVNIALNYVNFKKNTKITEITKSTKHEKHEKHEKKKCAWKSVKRPWKNPERPWKTHEKRENKKSLFGHENPRKSRKFRFSVVFH